MQILEVLANGLQSIAEPAKRGWAMTTSAFRLAWRDMRDLPAAMHLSMIMIEVPDISPPRLKFSLGIINASVYDVYISYSVGRPKFAHTELSGIIDQIEPILCKPRQTSFVKMIQWISGPEREMIDSWNKDSGERSFDLTGMRFHMRIKGTSKVAGLEILGPHSMKGGSLGECGTIYVWNQGLDMIGDRDRARAEFARTGEPY